MGNGRSAAGNARRPLPAVRTIPGHGDAGHGGTGDRVLLALNNIWDTNFPAQQQGETTFRYALASARGENPRVLGMRTAAGLTDPLVAVPLSGRATASTAAASRIFTGTDHDLVHVSSLTPARRGHGLAVWLRSVVDRDVEVTVHLPWQPDQAHVGTTLERDLRPVRVDGTDAKVPVPAGAMVGLIID